MQDFFSPLIGYLATLGPWNWFVAAGILLVLETLMPGVYLMWFGVAAFITGVVAVPTGLAWQHQLILFAATSVATLLLGRWYAPDGTQSDEPDLNVRGTQYIGRVYTVSEAIVGGRGKILVGDSPWIAKGPDLPLGTAVKVIGVEGTTLVVEKVRL